MPANRFCSRYTPTTVTQVNLTGSGIVGAVTVADSASAVLSNNNNAVVASLTTGDIAFNGTATVDTFNVNTSAAIVAGALSTNAAGTTTLSGANTYTGATTIEAGTLALSAGGSIDTSTSATIKPTATPNISALASYTIPTGNPVNFGIDGTGSGSSGKITAANSDVSNATVSYDITGPLDDPAYVLATYSRTLKGTFLSVPAAPAGYTLNYAFEGNKIALVQSVVAAPTTPGPPTSASPHSTTPKTSIPTTTASITSASSPSMEIRSAAPTAFPAKASSSPRSPHRNPHRRHPVLGERLLSRSGIPIKDPSTKKSKNRLTDLFPAELIPATKDPNGLCPSEAQPRIAKAPIP